MKKTQNNDWSGGAGILPGRETIGPLFLMGITPIFSMVFFHVNSVYSGDFRRFLLDIQQSQSSFSLYDIWPSPWDSTAWQLIASFVAMELLLVRAVPGPEFVATMTPTGHRPVYTANGMACYLITLLTIMGLHHFSLLDAALIYDHFGNILSSMNVLAWLFCTLLLVKGRVAPSGADSGTTGSWLQDFYWGMELYPRILGFDVKQCTNCRLGMMFWAVAIVGFAYKNASLNDGVLQYGMAVSVFLQLVYISKFFYWEMGYMCSMDIQHDRAGYYICWGCLVWVPAVYTSAAFYLTTSGPPMSALTALLMALGGWICIWINYDSDRQRYVFRQTNGDCLIWNHAPKHIVASYSTAKREVKTSLLLVDGWWAWSRHFHYVPEILASFVWSLPALDSGFVGPYFYVIYLIILLTDRAFRDDNRCRAKYGKDWDTYCAQVPSKIVPGVL